MTVQEYLSVFTENDKFDIELYEINENVEKECNSDNWKELPEEWLKSEIEEAEIHSSSFYADEYILSLNVIK